MKKCQECSGKTIFFSGTGLNMQYMICSQWEVEGHKTAEEIKHELANLRKSIRPSGRFA